MDLRRVAGPDWIYDYVLVLESIESRTLVVLPSVPLVNLTSKMVRKNATARPMDGGFVVEVDRGCPT
jgi:hypothetical protein